MIDGKPFTDFLREVEDGYLNRDLTNEINKVIAAVRETRKAGKLKLVLEFTPTGKGAISVDADYDATVPEHDRPSTTFFTDSDGQLVRDDPRQPKLPLREVMDGETGEIKAVND
mgnify:FL=1|jgi:hypothetical protein